MNIKTSSQNLPKVKLIDALSLIRNGMSIKQGVVCGGLPITRIETISNGEICLEKVGYAGLEKRESSGYILKEGDILFSHINSPTHLGKTAIYNKDQHGDLIHGMNLLCLRANQEKAYPKYLNYAINAPTFKSQLPKITKKAVNQASIAIADLKELEILLPPLPEQKRIATILDKADNLRRKNQQAIQLADKFLRAVFLYMFGDLSKSGDKKVKLGDVVLVDAPMVDPREDQYIDMLHFGPDRIEKNTGYLLPALTAREEKLISKKFLFDDRYVLYSKIRPYLKKCALAETTALCSADMYPIRPVDGLVTKEFLWRLLLSDEFTRYTETLPGRANIPKLNRDELSSFEFSLPNIKDQHRFSNVVRKLKSASNLFEKSNWNSNHVFDALSQKAFAGEL